MREAGIAACVAALALATALVSPHVLSAETARIFLLTVPLLLIVASGELLVVVAGHVDISVGSVLALGATLAGLAFREAPGLPLWMGFLIGIGAGAAAGCVNAMLVNGLRIHSIIATLATLSIFRGIVFVVSDGRQISADELPPALLGLAGAGAVPTILLLSLAPAIAAHLLLTRTAFGRQLFAIGSNAEAAALRGLPVHRATGWAFVLSGAAAGFAGVVYAARFGVVNPSSAGTGFELAVIAAVILGGASISGGVGSAVGTVLGVMLIALIEISLPALGVPHVWQGVIFGAVIVAALLIDRATRGVEQPP